jgi:hypothetical protein
MIFLLLHIADSQRRCRHFPTPPPRAPFSFQRAFRAIDVSASAFNSLFDLASFSAAIAGCRFLPIVISRATPMFDTEDFAFLSLRFSDIIA